MSLLSPLFLLGLLTIALPIWLHRLQTQTSEREQFGSTMFLQASEHRIHLKKKLRYLVLLALRILLLVLLVLAFTKPVLLNELLISDSSGASLHLIAIDTSLSMNDSDRIERAKNKGDEIINSMNASDQAVIIAAGRDIRIVASQTADANALRKAIATIRAGSDRLDMGVLMANMESLRGEWRQNISIHVISDFQLSGLPSRFAELIPDIGDRSLSMNIHPLVDGNTTNYMVEAIHSTESGISVTVRGTNSEEREVQVNLDINGVAQDQQLLKVVTNGLASIQFDNVVFEPGDNRITASIESEDELEVDDIRYAVVDDTPAAPVLLLSQNPTDSIATTYLTAALEAGNKDYRIEAVRLGEFDPRILQRYAWIIIEDLGAIDATIEKALRNYLDAGGAIFSALDEQALQIQTLPLTGQTIEGVYGSLSTPNFQSIARIDTSHPALAQTIGWRSVNFSRVLPLSAGNDGRVLISLDSGASLLTEHNVGRGKLVLLSTNLQNSWNDLPIHPVFVSFVAELSLYLSGKELLKRQQVVGDTLLLKQSGSASGQVVDPFGDTVLTLADTLNDQNVKLSKIGFYEVYTLGRETVIAVNPDPRESELTTMTTESLERWKNAVSHSQEESPTIVGGAVDEPSVAKELWHTLLLILAFIVLAESVLGNRYLALKTGYVE